MADISYTPTTWADGSEGGTPIDAAKLNNIEQGIVDAVGAIGPNDTTADGTIKAQIDALGESVSKVEARGPKASASGNMQLEITTNDNHNIKFFVMSNGSLEVYYDNTFIKRYQ